MFALRLSKKSLRNARIPVIATHSLFDSLIFWESFDQILTLQKLEFIFVISIESCFFTLKRLKPAAAELFNGCWSRASGEDCII